MLQYMMHNGRTSMKYLVTGGAGFIAHHMVKKLLDDLDAEIVCLDKLDFSGNLNRLHDSLKDDPRRNRVRFVYHDLRAEINTTTENLIGDIDYILHMAANPHVDKSIRDPLSSVMDNVVGTCNILNYARKLDLKKFIYFSTDEVFGHASDKTFFNEYSRYNSGNPYSASKAGGEELAVSFYNTYKVPVNIIHSMNVYGERQQKAAFIPICISKIFAGECLNIHSDETLTKVPTRKYVYIDDVTQAISLILKSNVSTIEDEGLLKVPKYNIIGEEVISILDIAKNISDILDKELKFRLTSSDRPGVDLHYSLSGSKIKELGWEQKYKFLDTIPKVVKWFSDNKQWLNV